MRKGEYDFGLLLMDLLRSEDNKEASNKEKNMSDYFSRGIEERTEEKKRNYDIRI